MTDLDDLTDAPLPRLPKRELDSHKGDYGRALLIGGSCGMGGAIALAGRATLRSGAGLVTLAVPQCVQDLVASFEPSYMTHGLAEENGRIAESAIDDILGLATRATIVAVGPGLGRDAALTGLIDRMYREIDMPMVVDADGLFALAETGGAMGKPGGPRVLTPHIGEFARFTGKKPDHERHVEAAAGFAAKDPTGKRIVVLKGHRTVVTDGQRFSVNQTGNPGMATGGTGDVLTGIITGLLCQGLSPFDAARLGTHAHGMSGDLALESVGEVSMIAGDLIDYLPMAFLALQRGRL